MPFRAPPVLCCALLLVSGAHAQVTPMGPMGPMQPPRAITVAGSGTVVAEPDKARVQLTVQKSDPDMGKARAEALAVVEKFLALTKKLGIDPKQVRTTSAIINPEYRWDPPSSRQVFIGYQVQRQLEVELTSLDKLGALVEGAVDAGVNNVAPPTLDSSRRRELTRQALAAAARDAESNATTIAETLGVKLGRIRDLTASDSMAPPPPMPMPRMRVAAMAAEAADAGAASYTPGSLEFEARVTATFDVIVP